MMVKKVKMGRTRVIKPRVRTDIEIRYSGGYRGRLRSLVLFKRRRVMKNDRRQPPLLWRYRERLPQFVVWLMEDVGALHRNGERGHRCDTPKCLNNGYGPMLRTVVWRAHFWGHELLCESCMVRKLGRPLGPYDLRDCELNHYHPYYVSHGMQ